MCSMCVNWKSEEIQIAYFCLNFTNTLDKGSLINFKTSVDSFPIEDRDQFTIYDFEHLPLE